MRRAHNITLLVLLLALVLFMAGACNKSNQNPVYLNADMKKYYEYQSGTYWIFYDSLNHCSDSLRVWSYIDEQPYTTSGSGQNTEDAGFWATDYNSNSIADSLSWLLSSTNGTATGLSISQYAHMLSYALTSGMPFITGNVAAYSYGYTYTCELLPVYDVNNVVYNNVYVMTYVYTTGSYRDVFYINADHGFLKVILNNQYFHKSLYLVKGNLIR